MKFLKKSEIKAEVKLVCSWRGTAIQNRKKNEKLGRARCRSRRVWFCSALGNVVWPKLLNENRGKVLQQLPLMIIFPQMAKNYERRFALRFRTV